MAIIFPIADIRNWCLLLTVEGLLEKLAEHKKNCIPNPYVTPFVFKYRIVPDS